MQKSLIQLSCQVSVKNLIQLLIPAVKFNRQYFTFIRKNKDNRSTIRVVLNNFLPNVSTRLTSTNTNYYIPKETSKAAKEDLLQFNSLWSLIKEELIEFTRPYDIDDGTASNWLNNALEYNVPHGKKNRGLMVIQVYKSMASNEQSEENIRLACILGWCLEMALLLIQDDIEDSSLTRRGKPTWHSKDEVGLLGVNDSTMMIAGINKIIKKHFEDKIYYHKLMETFSEVLFATTVGQSLDIQMTRRSVTEFTMKVYETINRNKTYYYTFYCPVALAMHMTGNSNSVVFKDSQAILLEISKFFQIQDDYLDIFGDPNITGKHGTDIQDNKCTWFAVKCNELSSLGQKRVLKANYGHHNPEKVARVKELFKELKLQQLYRDYEEQAFHNILDRIKTSPSVPADVFTDLLHKLNSRQS